jgi:hypothetical protein
VILFPDSGEREREREREREKALVINIEILVQTWLVVRKNSGTDA